MIFAGQDFYELRSSRIKTRNTHGTGCSLASCIAAELAKGSPMLQAVKVTSYLLFYNSKLRSNTYLSKNLSPNTYLIRGHLVTNYLCFCGEWMLTERYLATKIWNICQIGHPVMRILRWIFLDWKMFYALIKIMSAVVFFFPLFYPLFILFILSPFHFQIIWKWYNED